MKNIILILFIALVSCSGSDDNTPTNIDENLVGKWSLTQYGKWISEPYNYTNDEIIWEFKQDGTLTVTVEEQATIHPDMYIQTSGTYNYFTELIEPNEYQSIQISSVPEDRKSVV